MAEQKRKIPMLGKDVDVTDVPAVQATERVNDYTLEDGTVLRVRGAATSFLRVDGEYLPNGQPFYLVFMSPAIEVISSPLAKKVN